MSVITVQSVKMVTANMLLRVFFVSGALADCPADPALFITAPKNMEALNGSCLQIPCNYSAESGTGFDITKTTFGVWIKNNLDFANNPNNVIFNGSKANNINPIHITGNLSLRNCTTLYSSLITNYTDTYFFRIESTSFRATASCDPLQITVKDSPQKPSIEVPRDLKEKESVTITCSASTPCPHSPPKLTWNLTQDPHNTIEENTDQTLTTKIQETITLSDKHDGVTITCSATYPVDGGNFKTAEERKTLNVSYAPKDTSVSISPSDLVSAGSWVNLTCSSRANPPVSSFTWFKTSKDGPIKVFDRDYYSFNVTDGGIYYCVATNDLGNGISPEIHLYIEDSPQKPSIEVPRDLKEKESVTITCSASTPCPHSPPKLTWNLTQDPHNTIEENTDQTLTTKIQETITLSDKHDGVTITCSATYPVDGGNFKTAEERKTLNVSYAPKDTSVSISPSDLVSAGSWVNLTCSSRANPPVSSFTWFKTSKDGPIKVFDRDYYSFNVTDGGIYYCVATNDLGNGISPEIHLYIEGGDSSVQWAAILGGIFGILVLICLVVCVWRLKSTHSTAQQTQSQTDEELVVEEQARKAEEEDIHYGEIDFSKRRPEASSASKQDSGQQQDVLYAQIKVSNTTNSLGQTADSPEDLYAQVKKK
ncbi:B-cell receptor CD22-like [Epinephelus lanceolatus]